MDVAAGLLGVVQVAAPDKAQVLASQYAKERDRYAGDATQIQNEAQAREAESRREEGPGPAAVISGRGCWSWGLVLTSFILSGPQTVVSGHRDPGGGHGYHRGRHQFLRLSFSLHVLNFTRGGA